MSDAHAVLSRTVISRSKAFESSSDYLAAQGALTKAQAEYRAVADRVMAIAADRPDYIAAMRAQREAQARLDQLRAAHSTDSTALARLAADVMSAGATAHKIEYDALSSDKTVQDARDRLQPARQELDRLRSEFATNLRADHDWQASREAMTNASQKLISAERAFAAPSH